MQDLSRTLTGTGGVLLFCLLGILLLYGLVLSVLYPAILVMFSRVGTFASCFKLREAVALISKNAGPFFTAWAVSSCCQSWRGLARWICEYGGRLRPLPWLDHWPGIVHGFRSLCHSRLRPPVWTVRQGGLFRESTAACSRNKKHDLNRKPTFSCGLFRLPFMVPSAAGNHNNRYLSGGAGLCHRCG